MSTAGRIAQPGDMVFVPSTHTLLEDERTRREREQRWAEQRALAEAIAKQKHELLSLVQSNAIEDRTVELEADLNNGLMVFPDADWKSVFLFEAAGKIEVIFGRKRVAIGPAGYPLPQKRWRGPKIPDRRHYESCPAFSLIGGIQHADGTGWVLPCSERQWGLIVPRRRDERVGFFFYINHTAAEDRLGAFRGHVYRCRRSADFEWPDQGGSGLL